MGRRIEDLVKKLVGSSAPLQAVRSDHLLLEGGRVRVLEGPLLEGFCEEPLGIHHLPIEGARGRNLPPRRSFHCLLRHRQLGSKPCHLGDRNVSSKFKKPSPV